ncbi:hypothetical protein ScPMuIL_000561 [Solemya velum]
MAAELEDGYPKFQLKKSRFDQSTFYGRWRHFLDVIDPSTLFTSEDELKSSIKLLEDYKNGIVPAGITDRALWEAQKTKQAIIHPDTGEKVFMPFRMSGFVPFGAPMVVGMLLPNPTMPKIIFWQWLNQSHNAAVNYSNRNASKPTPVTRFLMGYFGAVSSAVSIALGLNMFISRASNFSAGTKMMIQKFVPFPAVATANICNVVLMRNNELAVGIDVVDKNEKVVGTSKVAAKKALFETALTRVFLPAPILLIPPVIMSMFEKTRLLRNNPRLHLPFNALTCTATFAFALPLAIALFPQYSQIATADLEPEFKNLTQEETLFYNKGL